MKTNRHGVFCGHKWICPTAAVVGFAVLLVIGPAVTVFAGPAQEKGQEETKEKNDQPKKYTNEDLKKHSPPPDSGGESEASAEQGAPPETPDGAESGDPDAEPTDPWDSVGVATDNQGRGEDYWRKAMTEAKTAVTNARQQRAALQSEMNRRRADFTAIDDPAARDTVNARIQELFDLLAEADQAIAGAEQALQDLEEEARRSGALPGWLR